MKPKEEESQLCWNCKRCTNPDGLRCPWAENGALVEGWVATQGREYYKYDVNGKKTECIGNTYFVTECPLYIKDKQYGTYKEALKHISEVLEIKYTTIGSNKTLDYIKKYEKLTGEKVPYWIKYHTIERKIFENCSQTLDNSDE